ncbi:MAG: hypothetical protein R6V58_00340, partial [Planctomycetota bacterium]
MNTLVQLASMRGWLPGRPPKTCVEENEMHRRSARLLLILFLGVAAHAAAAKAEPGTVRIPVDVTLYKKHQACLADVRGTAGRILELHLLPSVG